MPHLPLDDGFELYYEVHGPTPGSAPAVLLAHGAGGNTLVWWQQIPEFSERYTTIAFDHRAFGRSPDLADGPGRVAFGTDTLALIEHVGVDRVHFVAHSMGGRTAFGLFTRAPQRIASITYSGTNGGVTDDDARARKVELEAEGFFAGSLLRRALAETTYDSAPELAFLYRQLRGINPPRPRDFLAPFPRRMNYRGSTSTRLTEAGIPILWLVGEEDRVVAPELIRRSHELTPGSRFQLLPGAGHSSYFETPDAWNRAVLGFIGSVEERLPTAK
ncbi:MAG: alpha/beta hydrolase [Dehalococcoidia bacterium]